MILGEREHCCCDADHLTEREVDVLCGIAAGRSNKEIGEWLCISHRTVDHHVGSLLQRCHARNRQELITVAYLVGLLMPGSWPPERSGRRCIRLPADSVDGGSQAGRG